MKRRAMSSQAEPNYILPPNKKPPNKKKEQGPPSLFLPFFREPFRSISETV